MALRNKWMWKRLGIEKDACNPLLCQEKIRLYDAIFELDKRLRRLESKKTNQK